jgi:uncharacterized membrane protein YtjA (UPF0391 family)
VWNLTSNPGLAFSGRALERARPRGEGCEQLLGDIVMLGWAITFFIIAIIAAALGFGGIAGSAVSIAQILFVIFLILFLISLVWHLVSGRRPPPVI